MNIWILNHYAITPNLPGGTRHFDFGKELSRRSYNVTIFASSFHYSLLKEIKSYDNNDYITENINDNFRFVWDDDKQDASTDYGNAWVEFDTGDAYFGNVSVEDIYYRSPILDLSSSNSCIFFSSSSSDIES